MGGCCHQSLPAAGCRSSCDGASDLYAGLPLLRRGEHTPLRHSPACRCCADVWVVDVCSALGSAATSSGDGVGGFSHLWLARSRMLGRDLWSHDMACLASDHPPSVGSGWCHVLFVSAAATNALNLALRPHSCSATSCGDGLPSAPKKPSTISSSATAFPAIGLPLRTSAAKHPKAHTSAAKPYSAVASQVSSTEMRHMISGGL